MKRHVYLEMKGLEEARSIFSRVWQGKETSAEEINVEDALGRVTSEPVFARISAPSYHSAAMDGIAVRAEETYGAAEKTPKILDMGSNALWINTGQALPEGYNAVIMIEKIHQPDETRVEIRSSAYPWQNVRKVGEDMVATQLLFPQSHVIRSCDMGALVAAGIFRVMVRRKPRVIIIPTGSELVRHRDIADLTQLRKDQIIESNSVTLSGLVREAQGEPHVFDITPDEEGEIRDALLRAADSDADLIIINAGSSAGSRDYTADIVGEIGEVLVHGVAMMPGKPTILGVIHGKPVIGIPGYTVSAILSFEQFARPLLFGLQSLAAPKDRFIPVQPSVDIPSKLGMEEFIRVHIGKVGDRFVATPLPRAAGSITTLTRAEGIIRIPSFSEGVRQDESVNAELLVDEEELLNTLVVIGSHDITIDILADEIRHTTGEYNVSYVKRYLKGTRVSLFRLVFREQGLIVQKNNPKGIKGIKDLTRDDISFVNRQAGSGTRILFDYTMARAGIKPESIKGYTHEEFTHMSVAVDVLSGVADCGMAIYAAAKALDLDFIPLHREQYDLVIPGTMLGDQNIVAVLDTIRSQGFRDRVESLGGYDPARSGELLIEI